MAKVTNPTGRKLGVLVDSGPVVVKPGKTFETDEEIHNAVALEAAGAKIEGLKKDEKGEAPESEKTNGGNTTNKTPPATQADPKASTHPTTKTEAK